MPEGKRIPVNPLILTDEMFVKLWESKPYQKNPYPFETENLQTDRGEIVRSKSELHIANALYNSHIPYRYEYPLQLADNRQVYPDFFCLNVRKRKEIVWEHPGAMDNVNYVNSNIRKLELYNLSNYVIGDNLILTTETTNNQLNTNMIKNIINRCLL